MMPNNNAVRYLASSSNSSAWCPKVLKFVLCLTLVSSVTSAGLAFVDASPDHEAFTNQDQSSQLFSDQMIAHDWIHSNSDQELVPISKADNQDQVSEGLCEWPVFQSIKILCQETEKYYFSYKNFFSRNFDDGVGRLVMDLYLMNSLVLLNDPKSRAIVNSENLGSGPYDIDGKSLSSYSDLGKYVENVDHNTVPHIVHKIWEFTGWTTEVPQSQRDARTVERFGSVMFTILKPLIFKETSRTLSRVQELLKREESLVTRGSTVPYALSEESVVTRGSTVYALSLAPNSRKRKRASPGPHDSREGQESDDDFPYEEFCWGWGDPGFNGPLKPLTLKNIAIFRYKELGYWAEKLYRGRGRNKALRRAELKKWLAQYGGKDLLELCRAHEERRKKYEKKN